MTIILYSFNLILNRKFKYVKLCREGRVLFFQKVYFNVIPKANFL